MRVTKKLKEQQIHILEETYRGTKPALVFNSPFELLIAVILSAQCTDKRVNVTTGRLFQKANTPAAILSLGLKNLEDEIRDCGLFRNKAKNILATCKMLIDEHKGEVPESMEDLEKLPGVGRKTANVVRSIARHCSGYPCLSCRKSFGIGKGIDTAGRGKRTDAGDSKGKVVGCASLADMAWSAGLQSTKARLSHLPFARGMPKC